MKRTLYTLLLLATPSFATLGGGVLMARLGSNEARVTSDAPRPSEHAASHARTFAQRTMSR